MHSGMSPILITHIDKTLDVPCIMFVPTVVPLQVLHRGSSRVALHFSPAYRVGGVAVPLPLVQGSILVGSLGTHCSQCPQSQGASLCTSNCTHSINLCGCIHVCTGPLHVAILLCKGRCSECPGGDLILFWIGYCISNLLIKYKNRYKFIFHWWWWSVCAHIYNNICTCTSCLLYLSLSPSLPPSSSFP